VTEQTIDIGVDFSPYPAGRYRKLGPASGEAFRDDLLVPALGQADIVRVLLDTSRGYGSSFLDEAFGGLIRNKKLGVADLHRKLKLVSKDEALVSEIWQYIDEAAKAK